MEIILNDVTEKMDKSVSALKNAFNKIRTGRANPSILDDVKVDYYGNLTPINQTSNITVEEGRSLVISPWDNSLIPEIEKGIHLANIGFNPMNNGDSVIINVPPLTEERRRELAKQAKAEAEDSKIGVRNDRKNAMNSIKEIEGASDDLKKSLEDDVQKMTDASISKIDALLAEKEKEIMTV